MKKLWLPVLLASAFVVSCTKGTTSMDGTGTLILSSTVNNGVIDVTTRANMMPGDFTGYVLTLEGPDIEEMSCPADGKIEGLTPGDYIVGLSNLTADFVPAFGDPRYGGTKSATVIAGGQTPVAIVLTQANAGVRFVYDQSLADTGLGAMVATVAQDGNALSYGGANRDATGYFAPGEVALTLDNGGEVITIGGQANKKYTLAAKEVWTITLKVAATTRGLSVSAEIDVTVTDKTDEVEVDAGSGDSGGETLITFNGLQWMDRNLGATSADFENDWNNAIGSFFQWGRNVAFGTSGFSTVGGPLTATEVASDENKNCFITKMSGDWLSVTDATRWQNVAGQPCPEGYRMPTIADLYTVFTASGVLVNTVTGPAVKTENGYTAHYWGDKSRTVYGIKKVGSDNASYMKWEYLTTSAGNGYMKVSRWAADATATFAGKDLATIQSEFAALGTASEEISFPTAGYLSGSNGTYGGGTTGGYYWSSSLGSGDVVYRAEFTSAKMIAGDETYKSKVSGHSVRCVKM